MRACWIFCPEIQKEEDNDRQGEEDGPSGKEDGPSENEDEHRLWSSSGKTACFNWFKIFI